MPEKRIKYVVAWLGTRENNDNKSNEVNLSINSLDMCMIQSSLNHNVVTPELDRCKWRNLQDRRA